MVRMAVREDIPELAELFMELHEHHVRLNPKTFRMPPDDYFTERMTGLVNDEGMKVFVHCGSGIDGYAAVKIMDVDTEEKIPRRMCYIDCFAVSERSRRQGAGTELFSAVKEFARENDCNTVQLGVSADNRGAVEFYNKMGLTPRTIQMKLYL